MISVEEVANHFGLRPDTVRRKIRSGEIDAIRIGRVYRLAWPDVWACEDGPMPKRARLIDRVSRVPPTHLHSPVSSVARPHSAAQDRTCHSVRAGPARWNY